MGEGFDHKVLIVDDKELAGKALGRFLKSIGVNYVYKGSCPEALEEVKKIPRPFSLIISDQIMPSMTGSEFFEKVKEISPDTVRFILSGHSDMDAIITAVNKGSVNKFLIKPWENDDLVEKIESAFNQFELSMESDKLFKLAKEQNTKLYQLNMELKRSSDAHKASIVQLNNEIDQLTKILDSKGGNRDFIKEIMRILKQKGMLNEEKLSFLYSAIINEIFERFKALSAENGFEMPAELKKS